MLAILFKIQHKPSITNSIKPNIALRMPTMTSRIGFNIAIIKLTIAIMKPKTKEIKCNAMQFLMKKQGVNCGF